MTLDHVSVELENKMYCYHYFRESLYMKPPCLLTKLIVYTSVVTRQNVRNIISLFPDNDDMDLSFFYHDSLNLVFRVTVR